MLLDHNVIRFEISIENPSTRFSGVVSLRHTPSTSSALIGQSEEMSAHGPASLFQ